MVLAWAGMGGLGALADGPDTTPKINTTNPTTITASEKPQPIKFVGTNLQGIAKVALADSANQAVTSSLGAHDANQLTVTVTLVTPGQFKLTATDSNGQSLTTFTFTVAAASAGGASATGSSANVVPTITSIDPAAPLIRPNEALVLSGTGFKDGVVVKFTDAEGHSSEGTVLTPINDDRLVVTQTLGIAGKWTVSAANVDANKSKGKFSEPLAFAVANGPQPDANSPQVKAFWACAIVSTLLLLGLIIYVLVALIRAQKGGWSLGEALSEESTYQPKVITQKSDVIIYASTSRVIALIGLMGILSIVVGIGYTVMWNLTVYGTVPDLSQVRSYLYGAACLFAPYLANQLSSMFTPSAKPQTGDDQAPKMVTGVVPATPKANGAAAQQLRITGSGFQQGLSLSLTNPLNQAIAVAAADVMEVASTMVTANLKLDTPGSWKVVVANPAATAMAPFGFSVVGPPTLTSVTAVAGAAAMKADPTNMQKIAIVGTGFVSGLTVQLTPPAGGAGTPSSPSVETLTPQQVTLSAKLDVQGNWSVVVTNPGNQPSAELDFAVAP